MNSDRFYLKKEAVDSFTVLPVNHSYELHTLSSLYECYAYG